MKEKDLPDQSLNAFLLHTLLPWAIRHARIPTITQDENKTDLAANKNEKAKAKPTNPDHLQQLVPIILDSYRKPPENVLSHLNHLLTHRNFAESLSYFNDGESIFSKRDQIYSKVHDYVSLRIPSPNDKKRPWRDHCLLNHPNFVNDMQTMGEAVGLTSYFTLIQGISLIFFHIMEKMSAHLNPDGLEIYAFSVIETVLNPLTREIWHSFKINRSPESFASVVILCYLEYFRQIRVQSEGLLNLSDQLLLLIGFQLAFLANTHFKFLSNHKTNKTAFFGYMILCSAPRLMFGTNVLSNGCYELMFREDIYPMIFTALGGACLNCQPHRYHPLAMQTYFVSFPIIGHAIGAIFSQRLHNLITQLYQAGSINHYHYNVDRENRRDRLIRFCGKIAVKPRVRNCALAIHKIAKIGLHVLKTPKRFVKAYFEWRLNYEG